MRKWLRTTESIEFAVKGRVAYVTLNRPECRNALSPELLAEYRSALLEADDLRAVSAIVVAGNGKDFCAGYDMKGAYARYASEHGDEASPYRTGIGSFDDDSWKLERSQEMLRTPFDIHKPVIAKVHGNCVAGGTDLALYCDMIIAADNARIGFPATRAMGSPPNHMWIYNVGPQWAKRLLLTGDVLLGKDAAKIGLAVSSIPESDLDQEVERLANSIGSLDPELLACNKRIVNLALEVGGASVLQRLAAEMDARAHLTRAKAEFDEDVRALGFKGAAEKRDKPFGDGVARLSW
ncbi:crotonase/enoyl-CoA hydratase family protein [Cupriavidus metallidurans]|uniref:Enoyl-CoA hydratase/isomerase n=1 Tax=Cupriavidus metallidurans (strain ATCC 43123 / DSM 2839 / NBRC 102507 / CH34) TaxID=266264 RepID=Q1LBW2_CUPMC|nr:crotonase/enoyl-CoA hydratase family protein [Cupriavidus metallidurans]ABF12364.1 putative enoyl-CoA hydratase/isomerase [Cupriavidus metallidurans CH34]QGS32405.1 crotonase/enoyl-CoA hydratase family protein [Cupriavidus metallidurans]